MSTGAPQGGVRCGGEREHVPVTEKHVPLHWDGSDAREPRADTPLPEPQQASNDAHLDLVREAASTDTPGEDQGARMHDFFLENYLEAVGNGPRWHLVETGIHQGESQWAGVQPGHKSLQKFSLLFGGEGHCNVSLGRILTFFPFFCKRRTLNN